MASRRFGRGLIFGAVCGLAALYAGYRMGSAPAGRAITHPLTGRPIGAIATDAAWFERMSREEEETPERALDLIGIRAGMVVADVGAGTGYWTTRIAARVGPDGRVYATEVQPAMLGILTDKTRTSRLTNVTVVASTETEARLPTGAIDLILLVDVYHEFRYPQEMLRALRGALVPDGRLVLVEYRKEDAALPIATTHRMRVDEARIEVEAEGFVFDRLIPDLPRQHILVFRLPS